MNIFLYVLIADINLCFSFLRADITSVHFLVRFKSGYKGKMLTNNPRTTSACLNNAASVNGNIFYHVLNIIITSVQHWCGIKTAPQKIVSLIIGKERTLHKLKKLECHKSPCNPPFIYRVSICFILSNKWRQTYHSNKYHDNKTQQIKKIH